MAGRTVACCRASTRDQNPQLQLDALAEHGYDLLFEEKVSSHLCGDRPQFAAALTKLRADDTLVFWKSGRWGRSAAHVLSVVTELRERGVKVISLTESFDLDTKEGRGARHHHHRKAILCTWFPEFRFPCTVGTC